MVAVFSTLRGEWPPNNLIHDRDSEMPLAPDTLNRLAARLCSTLAEGHVDNLFCLTVWAINWMLHNALVGHHRPSGDGLYHHAGRATYFMMLTTALRTNSVCTICEIS
jgi:hypothetical protein